jgi:hypothetical protein
MEEAVYIMEAINPLSSNSLLEKTNQPKSKNKNNNFPKS